MDATFRRGSRVEESAELIAFDKLSEPSLREIAQHWETARKGHDMPGRADIHPAHFPRLLPRIFMIRVATEPLSFTYSLVGGENVDAHGRNFTGMEVRELDDLWPGYGTSMHNFYALVLRERRPKAARGVMKFVDRGFCAFESVYLPLATPEGVVSHIMGAAVYTMEKTS